MTSGSLVSIVLPTYNEKDNVLLLVKRINEVLQGYHYEVIVVDDSSPDGTYDAVLASGLENVRAILRTEDKGFAKSIRCGLENANGDILVIMDSDNNHRPEYLPFMIENIKYYDCVSASRFLYGGQMDSRTRHILSWVFNIGTRIATGGMVTDSLYGFLAIRRDVLEKCKYDDIFWGFGDYCIRLMYYLQKNGTTILQYPAVNGIRRYGTGNRRFMKTLIKYLIAVAQITVKGRLSYYVSRD